MLVLVLAGQKTAVIDGTFLLALFGWWMVILRHLFVLGFQTVDLLTLLVQLQKCTTHTPVCGVDDVWFIVDALHNASRTFRHGDKTVAPLPSAVQVGLLKVLSHALPRHAPEALDPNDKNGNNLHDVG